MSSVLTDLESAAKESAGNWLKFRDFCWHHPPDDADKWALFYANNRDSRLLDQSNADAIAKAMKPYIRRGTVREEHHSHWACGWVDGYAIKVYDRRGRITGAFKAWCEIQASLENYPCLDEEDYSSREYEATIENLRSASYDSDLYAPPEVWAGEVYSWLWDHTNVLENRDDQGGWASRDEIHRAMDALGWRITYAVVYNDMGERREEFTDEYDALERAAELRDALGWATAETVMPN